MIKYLIFQIDMIKYLIFQIDMKNTSYIQLKCVSSKVFFYKINRKGGMRSWVNDMLISIDPIHAVVAPRVALFTCHCKTEEMRSVTRC